MEEEDEEKPAPLIRDDFEEVDERMVVISFRAWIGLAALGIIFVAVLIWAFFGSITLTVEGRGISLTTGGVLNVVTKNKGRVVETNVKKGERIEKGTLIATIYDYELQVNLSTAIDRMNSLRQDLLAARRIAEKEDDHRKEGIRQNIEALEFSIEKRKEQIPFLEQDLEAKKRLYDEGLVSASQREQAVRSLMEEKIRLEETQAKIASLKADLKKVYKSDELKNYERLYRDAANEVKRLEARNVFQQIISPFEGMVIELQARTGEIVQEGQSIVWLEKPREEAEDLQFVSFVPADRGHRVEEGMPVTMQLFNVEPQKHGYLMGTVAEVSQYPVTAQYIFSIVQSKELVEFLSDNQAALIEVNVSPIPDPDTYSGFRWTSARGPDIEIHSGLLSFVKIAVEKRKPISYVFPEWWLP
jgi:HlyD family secretion protein